MEAIDYWLLDFKANWKKFITKRKNFYELGIAILIFSIVTYLFKKYLVQYEMVQGLRLHDILLEHIQAADVSVWIFVILYTAIFYNYLFLLAYPRILISFFIFYSVCLLLRFIMLSYINLEPPLGYTEFQDPILNFSTYGGHKITKDLFFSGHMITIFASYFAMPNLKLKRIFLVASIVLSILLIIQHIHYTIDILGAYIAVFLIYRVYFEKIYTNSKYNYQYSPEIINI